MSNTTLPAPARVMDALKAGRIAEARALLSAMPDPPPLLLAHFCARTGNVEGEIAALARVLETQPRNLQVLLAMGEAQQKTGDLRAATSFFRAALAQAGTAPVPPALVPLLERAQAHVAQNGGAFAERLEQSLPPEVARSSPRVRLALDLVLGKATLYQQQPSMFYFPGLAQRYFFEREEFSWAAELESRTPLLKAELEAAIADRVDFAPYVATSVGRPPPNNPLRDDPRWGSYYFLKSGETIAENAERCPATMDALAIPDLPHIPGRGPMALWSLLHPGTHIQPHNGMLNTRLICHLPLITPPGCGFRVGSEERSWEEGKLLIFDDTIEHEAWNRGSSLRVVLLFEIWRPDIAPEERAAITHILGAIEGPDFSQA